MSESPSNQYHRLQRASTNSPRPRPSFFSRQDTRNSEEAHTQALDESKRYHDRIYDVALITLETYNYEQLKAENDATEARVLAAERVAAEAEKARQLAERNAAADAKRAQEMKDQASADALRAKELEAQHAAAEASRKAQEASTALQAQAAAASAAAPRAAKERAPSPPASTPALQTTKVPPTAQKPAAPSVASSSQSAAAPTPSSTALQNGQVSQPLFTPTLSQQKQPALSAPGSKSPNPYLSPSVERLQFIHGNLKKMRTYMKSLCDQDVALKRKTGDMRRLVRMSVGQLTGGETDQAANKRQVQRVNDALKEALQNNVCPTPMMNIEDFVVEQREVLQNAANNGQLPVLFVFLLNHLAKAVMAQLALEGTKPLSALSIGIFTVRIFASPEYLWRGKSLIDILIAKYRVSCPVIFGVREDDTSDQGRSLLGWKKTPSGDWIALELHAQRMMGFAAGYAAICLRDFSKSATLSHPYAIAHYWKAIAALSATPSAELTKTHCYVLKALIDHFEKKFVSFYGSAAIAALQVATILVPKKVTAQNDATIALGALATKMHLDLGINLRHDAFRA